MQFGPDSRTNVVNVVEGDEAVTEQLLWSDGKKNVVLVEKNVLIMKRTILRKMKGIFSTNNKNVFFPTSPPGTGSIFNK